MSVNKNLISKINGTKKVCLLSDHHVCINPRLWKEAFFYEKKGYKVVIITMWLSKELLHRDLELLSTHAIDYKCYLNLIPGENNSLSRFFHRARKRIATELQKNLKIGTGWAISHAPGLMVKKALEENATLYSAHLECAFFAGKILIKAGKKVSFDFEDWYSRDYLVPGRPVRLLESLEKFALEKGLFCTAASKSMSTTLKNYFHLKHPPAVIYNGFSNTEAVKKKEVDSIDNNDHYTKLLWFSRTIGKGRGIEILLKALRDCEQPVQLHLLGKMKAGYLEYLHTEFAVMKKHQLIVHTFMPHNQLLPFISQFKIGLAIEENINDNKILTISNKILQYLQAGVYVLASDTKGQNEVAGYFPGSVLIVDINEPGKLSKAIDSLSKRDYDNKQIQKEQFKNIFSWEAQEIKLNKLVEKYL